jgi:hypothetical protein
MSTPVATAADNSVPSYVFDFSQSTEGVTSNFFDNALRSLVPGGSITLTVPTSYKSAKRNLMFAGFVEIASTTEGSNSTFTAAKPAVVASSAAAVKLSEDGEASWGWGVDATAPAELIDEAALLTDDVSSAPTFDCGTGTGPRKACKNCVCGLAQQEQEAAEQNAPAPKGGCGSCSLGDAFRCATCPSLGKPAWKEDGDKVKLDL